MSEYFKVMGSMALLLGITGVAEANPIYVPPRHPVPGYPGPVVGNPGFFPGPVAGHSRHKQRKALERYVEGLIRSQLGGIVRDVDVDIDDDEIEIEVESKHPFAYQLVHRLVCSQPQLRGYRIDIDIDD